MAPIRSNRRKKKGEKGVGPSAPSSSSQSQPQTDSLNWWDADFSRRISIGTSAPTFESFLRISRKTFDYICGLVKEEMSENSAKYTYLDGKVLSLNDRVAIALRRLSSGESLAAIRDLLGVHPTTVSHVTWWFVEAMEKRALHHIRWPSTVQGMKDIKDQFESILGLPNCCGAIATTNIKFCLSIGDPNNKVWCDEKNHPSMMLQAIVDPQMRFRDIVTGLPGSLTDSDVLKNSSFFKLSEEGKRLHGQKIELSRQVQLREYLVGHEGLPLLPWLLTPYRGKSLSQVKRSYNRRHYETWKVAKSALEKLKHNWKFIEGIMWRPDKHRLPRIIFVCCLLHNILIDFNDSLEDGSPFTDNNKQDQRPPDKQFPSKAATSQREKLALYLSASLPKQ